ncbi:MAG: tetratricopeptide repeat protein, partial [Cyanobacteria bacterium]|nr:tetratricopeptide repeat protein [Cyanobacteriota bacterium]
PSNIMLTNTTSGVEHVRVLDFGIARILPSGLNHTQNLTATGEIFGSPLYMSPEQCRGEEVDEKSDIYSFGCVMYRTLSGRCPFEGSNAFQTILKHVNDFPDPIENDKGEITPAINKVVMKCLEKDPRDRYQSFDQLRKDLTLVKAGLEPVAGPSIDAVKKKSRERRAKVFKLVSVSVCFVVTFLALISIPIIMTQKRPSLRECTERITQNPRDMGALISRGNIFLQDRQYRAAINDFNRALKLKPDTAESVGIYISRSECYGGLKQFKEELNDANKAIELQPDNPDGYYARAQAQTNLGQQKEALSDIDKNIAMLERQNGFNQTRVRLAKAYGERARAYDKLGNFEAAVSNATTALKLSPDYIRAYEIRGSAFKRLKKYPEALKDYNDALLQSPNAPELMAKRALLYCEMKLYDKALADSNDYIAMQPDYHHAFHIRAKVYLARRQSGDLEKALEDYNAALKMNPEDTFSMKQIKVIEKLLKDTKPSGKK